MLVFSVADFTQNTTKVFTAAQTDEVVINNNDGKRYKIIPIRNDIKKSKSPFEDIPYITANVTTQELVEIIRESRAGV